MDTSTVALLIGIPLLVVAISLALRYPMEEVGKDKERALDDLRSDSGLDFYLVSITTLIGSTVDTFGVSIPEAYWVAITCLALLSALVAFLYKRAWIGRRNLCLYSGLAFGTLSFCLAFYTLALA